MRPSLAFCLLFRPSFCLSVCLCRQTAKSHPVSLRQASLLVNFSDDCGACMTYPWKQRLPSTELWRWRHCYMGVRRGRFTGDQSADWTSSISAVCERLLVPLAAPAMGLRGSSPSSFCCSPSRIFVYCNTLFQGVYFYGLKIKIAVTGCHILRLKYTKIN